MIQTVEAVIDASGHVRLLGKVQVDAPRRALLTVLEEPASEPGESAILAEAALAADWSRPEEDAAWSHLQPVKSSFARPPKLFTANGGLMLRSVGILSTPALRQILLAVTSLFRPPTNP